MHSGASVLERFNGILGSMQVNGRSIKVKIINFQLDVIFGMLPLCVKRNVSAEGFILKTAKTII